MGLQGYLLVSALLFGIGAFGFMARRNAILMLISIELMFNAVNLSLVAFNAFLPAGCERRRRLRADDHGRRGRRGDRRAWPSSSPSSALARRAEVDQYSDLKE